MTSLQFILQTGTATEHTSYLQRTRIRMKKIARLRLFVIYLRCLVSLRQVKGLMQRTFIEFVEDENQIANGFK